MTSREKYGILSGSARIEGARLGVFWLVSFALFIGSFTMSLCGALWIATILLTPFYVGIRTEAFGRSMGAEGITYFEALGHSFLSFFYASLIFAIGQWAYFQYLDHGMVLSNYISILNDSKMRESLSAIGYTQEIIDQLIEAMQSLRPIDIALQFMWSNVVAGFFISLTTALYASFRHHKKI